MKFAPRLTGVSTLQVMSDVQLASSNTDRSLAWVDDDVEVGQQSAGDWSNLILWTEELGGLGAVQRLLYSGTRGINTIILFPFYSSGNQNTFQWSDSACLDI